MFKGVSISRKNIFSVMTGKCKFPVVDSTLIVKNSKWFFGVFFALNRHISLMNLNNRGGTSFNTFFNSSNKNR